MYRKILLIFLSSTFLLLHAETVRIMPLGDSITFDDAYPEVVKPDSLKAAYRSFLWYMLTEKRYRVDFVGSLLTGWDLVPPFDGDNEGHSGWKSSDIADHVYAFLQKNPADIILLMIGANDWSEDVSHVNRALDEIDRYESDYHIHIKVILARIPNRRTHYDWMSQFNRNLQTMADRRVARGDDIDVVDMEYGAGINYPDDFQDPTHPNDVAYEKMARVWFDALVRVLPEPSKDDILDYYMGAILPALTVHQSKDDMLDYYMSGILPAITNTQEQVK